MEKTISLKYENAFQDITDIVNVYLGIKESVFSTKKSLYQLYSKILKIDKSKMDSINELDNNLTNNESLDEYKEVIRSEIFALDRGKYRPLNYLKNDDEFTCFEEIKRDVFKTAINSKHVYSLEQIASLYDGLELFDCREMVFDAITNNPNFSDYKENELTLLDHILYK